MFKHLTLKNFLGIAVALVFGSTATVVMADTAYSGGSYPGSAYTVRKSTAAQKRMNPKLGQTSKSLSSSNPYEQRRVDIINRDRDYQIAVEKWEAKVAAKERKEQEKMEKAEERRQKEIQKAKEKQLRLASKAGQKSSKPSFLNFGQQQEQSSSTPALSSSTSAEREAELARGAAGTQDQQSAIAAKVEQPQLPVAQTEPENPSFLQRLKWAIFGR